MSKSLKPAVMSGECFGQLFEKAKLNATDDVNNVDSEDVINKLTELLADRVEDDVPSGSLRVHAGSFVLGDINGQTWLLIAVADRTGALTYLTLCVLP